MHDWYKYQIRSIRLLLHSVAILVGTERSSNFCLLIVDQVCCVPPKKKDSVTFTSQIIVPKSIQRQIDLNEF